MKVIIYPPVKEFRQNAYTVQFISGNKIDERVVPEYRINRYIENIISVSKEANNNIKFKMKEV